MPEKSRSSAERRGPSRSSAERRVAVALSYDTSLPAPVVSAKGRGFLAGRMEELAGEAGVPVVRDPALAVMLDSVDAGAFVPVQYWELVARVFVFIRKVVR